MSGDFLPPNSELYDGKFGIFIVFVSPFCENTPRLVSLFICLRRILTSSINCNSTDF